MTLWHITHSLNTESILSGGIDPKYSQGKFKRCWYVRWWGIVWAMTHVSMKKRVPVWQLVCFRVRVSEESVTHFNRNVFTSKEVVKTNFVMSAERALLQWEKQRVGRGKRPWQ